jgi:outer membrane protein
MMNESERNRLAAQFQEKVKEFNFLKQKLDSTVANRKQAFLEDARPEVDAAVQELMEEHDLDIILPSEAVVYVKPDMNLTGQLLEKLDR